MDRRGALIAAAAALAVALAGCGGDGEPDDGPQDGSTDPARLVGVEWRLTELVLDGDELDLGDVDARLRFDGAGRWSANACNSYGGSVELEPGRLTAGAGESTLIGCGPPGETIDRGVQAMLSGEASWSVTSVGLFVEGSGVEARFEPLDDPFPTPLDLVLLEGDDFHLGVAGGGLLWEGREGPGAPFGTAGFALPNPMYGMAVRQGARVLVFADLPAGTASASIGGAPLELTALDGGSVAAYGLVEPADGELVAFDATGAELGRSTIFIG